MGWQLIPYFEASGAVQMALDAWLLERHLQGKQPSTLRFYGWDPAAISLGYHQKRWPEHWSDLYWQGKKLEMVRRPSGGRAVLHQGELTYAVISSDFSGKRAEVYQQVCAFLVAGWQSLQCPLSFGIAGRGYIHNPNCFGTATGADLVLDNGAKFIGSAQLWRSGTVLQHGSMRLTPDPGLLETVFGGTGILPQLPPHLLGASGKQSIIEALMLAAQDCWNIELEPRNLSAAEWEEVRAIALQISEIDKAEPE